MHNSSLREAKLMFASGRLADSIMLFNRAEQEGSNIMEVCLSRGAARIALGKYAQAEADFCRVLENDNDSERAYYFRGIARAALGNYPGAIKDLTQSLTRNHDRGIAHLVRGLAYSELGNSRDAELDFNSASAFSEAELKSFTKLFGDNAHLFKNNRALLARENAPWHNLLSAEAADRLNAIFKRD